MDCWASEQLDPWLEIRQNLPLGALSPSARPRHRWSYDVAMRISTQRDADAARIMSRVWRWRIYGMLLIVAALLLVLLVSKI